MPAFLFCFVAKCMKPMDLSLANPELCLIQKLSIQL